MPKVQANSAGAGRRGRRIASSLAEINVVPLVDVMLVLLIIFMITAPMIQRGIDVNLPVARRSSQIAGERIFVSIPVNYRESHIVYLDQEPIRAEILGSACARKWSGRHEGGVPARRWRCAVPGTDGVFDPARRRRG